MYLFRGYSIKVSLFQINNVNFDYDIIMFIVKHISLVEGKDLSDMDKLKLVVNFLDENNLVDKCMEDLKSLGWECKKWRTGIYIYPPNEVPKIFKYEDLEV